MQAYLAHSVHKREEGKEIQKKLEDMGIEVYNPFYSHDRQDILDLDKGIVQPWNIVDEDKSRLIVDLDLDGLRKCDFLICVYPDGVSVGIPCEMMSDILRRAREIKGASVDHCPQRRRFFQHGLALRHASSVDDG